MATLVDNPVYELPSIGWHIEGRDAVLETYRRMLPGSEVRNVWADRRVHAISENELCREAYVYFDTPEGRTTGQYFAVMAFEGDKILGERMYMDTSFAKAMTDILGPDFGDIPGVSRLADTVSTPVPRLDRAAGATPPTRTTGPRVQRSLVARGGGLFRLLVAGLAVVGRLHGQLHRFRRVGCEE